jgi:hypothetical protein
LPINQFTQESCGIIMNIGQRPWNLSEISVFDLRMTIGGRVNQSRVEDRFKAVDGHLCLPNAKI